MCSEQWLKGVQGNGDLCRLTSATLVHKSMEESALSMKVGFKQNICDMNIYDDGHMIDNMMIII